MNQHADDNDNQVPIIEDQDDDNDLPTVISEGTEDEGKSLADNDSEEMSEAGPESVAGDIVETDDHLNAIPESPEPVTRRSRRLAGASPISPGGQVHRELINHNKPSTRILHGGSLFKAGYSSAIKHLSQQETGYVHVACAIAQYQNLDASQVTKQYGVRQGIKLFGQDGVDAVLKELKQIHDRAEIEPMDPATLDAETRVLKKEEVWKD